MTTPAPSQTRCPNCHAAVSAGKLKCICGLDVSKFDDFARAKKAAFQKGKRLEVEASAPPWYRDPLITKAAVVLIFIGLIVAAVYAFKATRPEPWESLPTTREEAVKQLLADINTDTDKSLDHSYLLIASENKAGQSDELRGKYRQLHHNINGYLSGEFGSDWLKIAIITPDPANTDRFIIRIGPETLHAQTAQESPKPTPPGKSAHYSTKGLEEFDVSDAGTMQQMAGISGFLKGYGADGSAKQLNSIVGALGGSRRESMIQTKMRLLPILRNPRDPALKRCTMESWKVRTDPVVRARLQSIVDDARYDPDVRAVAKSVLDESISEEELAAIGISK